MQLTYVKAACRMLMKLTPGFWKGLELWVPPGFVLSSWNWVAAYLWSFGKKINIKLTFKGFMKLVFFRSYIFRPTRSNQCYAHMEAFHCCRCQRTRAPNWVYREACQFQFTKRLTALETEGYSVDAICILRSAEIL